MYPLQNEAFVKSHWRYKVALIPIEKGETIKKGDYVAYNPETKEAAKPKKKSGYYAVGTALDIVKENGREMVLCRDGYTTIPSTENEKYRIEYDNLGEDCYFEDLDAVTMDGENTTKAGRIGGHYVDDITGEEEIVVRMEIHDPDIVLNPAEEKIYMFPVEDGETIKPGDYVVVNTRTLQASNPRKQSGYYAVGIALRIVKMGKKDMVICRDGYMFLYNTKKAGNRITKENYKRVCYFEDAKTVTLDNINTTKAGIVMDVQKNEDGNEIVLVEMLTGEGDGFEW